jgi:hypothetical protein
VVAIIMSENGEEDAYADEQGEREENEEEADADEPEDLSGHTHFVKVLVGRTGTAQSATEIGEASGTDVESVRESVRELMETNEALLAIRTLFGAGKNTDASTLLDGVTLFCLAEGPRGEPLRRKLVPFEDCSVIERWKNGTPYLYALVKPPYTAPKKGQRSASPHEAPSATPQEAPGPSQPPPAKRARTVPAEREFPDVGLLVVHAPLFQDPSSSGTGQDLGVPGHASQKDMTIDYLEVPTNKTKTGGGFERSVSLS